MGAFMNGLLRRVWIGLAMAAAVGALASCSTNRTSSAADHAASQLRSQVAAAGAPGAAVAPPKRPPPRRPPIVAAPPQRPPTTTRRPDSRPPAPGPPAPDPPAHPAAARDSRPPAEVRARDSIPRSCPVHHVHQPTIPSLRLAKRPRRPSSIVAPATPPSDNLETRTRKP